MGVRFLEIYIYIYSYMIRTYFTVACLEVTTMRCGQVYATIKDNSITYFTAKTMSFMRFNKATGEHSKIGDAVDFRELKTL